KQRLVSSGKWIPAYAAMGVPEILAELSKSQAKVTFGEGEKKTEKTLLEVFTSFLDGLPKLVPAGEIAKGASAARKSGKVVQFNETKHIGLDEASVLFDEAIRLHMEKTGQKDYGKAMQELAAKGVTPATVSAGGATANAV
ncbi:MAG: hypothetical protein ACRD2R_04335, partial [Terriglobales bacterium]